MSGGIMSIAQPSQPARGWLNWVPSIMFNIALPIATYILLTGNGMAALPALVISGVWPALELGLSMARTRHADEFSIMVLIFLVLGVITALAFNSARLLLIKDSALTGLFGLVLLGSLLAPRPLMFYFGRKFATDGTPERIAWWNGLWQYPDFRRGQRVLTTVWGVAFLGEAVLRILLSLMLPVSTMVVISNTLPYAVLAALIFGTVRYGRRSAERGRARAVALDRELA
jgi:uncharacterized membrane protein